MNTATTLILGLLTFISGRAGADMGKAARASGIARQEAERLKPSVGQARKMADLAEKYDFPIAQIRSLRDRGLGWREIDHTLASARKTERTPMEVADLREMGFGWADIERKLCVESGTPGDIPIDPGALEAIKDEFIVPPARPLELPAMREPVMGAQLLGIKSP